MMKIADALVILVGAVALAFWAGVRYADARASGAAINCFWSPAIEELPFGSKHALDCNDNWRIVPATFHK